MPSPITVLEQADPNPFEHQKRFAVEPIDFSGLHVDDVGEARFLSSKDPDQQRRWNNDKDKIGARLAEAVSERGADLKLDVAPVSSLPKQRPAPTFIVQLRALRLVPGSDSVVAHGPSALQLDVSIRAPDGRILDHFLLSQLAQGVSTTERFSRLGNCGWAFVITV